MFGLLRNLLALVGVAALVAGGVIGTGLGSLLFRLLQSLGQIDTVINILYVLMLGGIGGLVAAVAAQALPGSRIAAISDVEMSAE